MSLIRQFLLGSKDRWLVGPLEKTSGRTPKWIRAIIEDGLKYAFEDIDEPRADQTLFVARTAAIALRELGIKSRVVVGSARWNKFPIGFNYNGRAEFHTWLETEHDEIVDLTCDDLHHRRQLPVRVPKGPKSCWTPRKQVKGRKYTEVADAAEDCGVFQNALPLLDSVPEDLRAFIEANREVYEKRHR